MRSDFNHFCGAPNPMRHRNGAFNLLCGAPNPMRHRNGAFRGTMALFVWASDSAFGSKSGSATKHPKIEKRFAQARFRNELDEATRPKAGREVLPELFAASRVTPDQSALRSLRNL